MFRWPYSLGLELKNSTIRRMRILLCILNSFYFLEPITNQPLHSLAAPFKTIPQASPFDNFRMSIIETIGLRNDYWLCAGNINISRAESFEIFLCGVMYNTLFLIKARSRASSWIKESERNLDGVWKCRRVGGKERRLQVLENKWIQMKSL